MCECLNDMEQVNRLGDGYVEQVNKLNEADLVSFKQSLRELPGVMSIMPVSLTGVLTQPLKYFSASGYELKYGTKKSAGLDLPYYDEEKEFISIKPGERVALPTGVYCRFPEGYYGLVDTRSSTSKMKLVLGCRTLDEDYTGHIHVVLINCGHIPVTVKRGEFLAHMIISPYIQPSLNMVSSIEELGETERGANGFGSTGVGVNKEEKSNGIND